MSNAVKNFDILAIIFKKLRELGQWESGAGVSAQELK